MFYILMSFYSFQHEGESKKRKARYEVDFNENKTSVFVTVAFGKSFTRFIIIYLFAALCFRLVQL